MKHPIVKVILTVLILLVQLITSTSTEVNSAIAYISEIPKPQPFFKLSMTELSSIP